eukprot:scaffold2298_cov388-Prasinococcus_capsulatus_cf.AAC.13
MPSHVSPAQILSGSVGRVRQTTTLLRMSSQTHGSRRHNLIFNACAPQQSRDAYLRRILYRTAWVLRRPSNRRRPC